MKKTPLIEFWVATWILGFFTSTAFAMKLRFKIARVLFVLGLPLLAAHADEACETCCPCDPSCSEYLGDEACDSMPEGVLVDSMPESFPAEL